VFARAREKARSHSCRANLLNIGMALRMYAKENDGLYPPHDYDMSPLQPKYLDAEKIFECPSQRGSMYDGPFMLPPPDEDAEEASVHPSTIPGTAMTGRVCQAQEEAPPPGMEGPPGMPPEATLPPRYEDAPTTNYVYLGGGREHNEMPLAALVADSDIAHNARANVLMSDGAITSVPEGRWRALGFGEELPGYLYYQPPGESDPSMAPGMPPGPPGPPPGMEPGMEPGPPPDEGAPAPPAPPGEEMPQPPGEEIPPSPEPGMPGEPEMGRNMPPGPPPFPPGEGMPPPPPMPEEAPPE
jgi:hypothetical protein